MKTATFTIARPDTGAVLPLCVVTVYKEDGMTRATLYSANGDALGNPVTADGNGSITFASADGTYILSPVSADGTLSVPPITVDLYDLPAIQSTMAAQVSAAAVSAAQAIQAATTAQGFCNSLTDPATALPFEVTAISGGIGTGSGGTPGTYALGVTGGPPGFKATVTIGGDGKVASYAIINPGIATTNSAPTLSLSGVTGLTGATTPTATVGTAPVGRVFIAPSSNGQNFLAWMNAAGALSQFPSTGNQYSQPSSKSLDARVRFLDIDHPKYAVVFGKTGGPILGGILYSGSWEFLGVRYMPIKAADGTVAAVVSADSARTGYLWRAYDTASGAILFGVKSDGTFVAKMSIAEVTAARGSAADLNTRLSRGLTPAGSPKTGMQNISRLPNWRSALTFLKGGGTGYAHAIIDWDSWGDAKTYGTADAIARFFADSGLTNAGPGWIGLASAKADGTAIHGTAQNNIAVARTGTWTDLFPSADASPGTPQNFPGYDATQSAANGSIYTITSSQLANAIYLRLFCGKGSGIEYSWDGGSTYTALTITSGSGSTYVDISLTGKTGSLKLRCASGAIVAGLFCLTSASGVIFSNLSNSGSTAAQKASVQSNADYKAMMAALPGDAFLALVQLGLNDTRVLADITTITANVAVVGNGYKAIYSGFPSVDVMTMCQPNCAQSVQDTLAPLLRASAEDNGFGFLDWQNYFGIPAYSGDYAGYSRDYTSGAASTALPLLEKLASGTSYRHPSTTAQLVAASKSAIVTGSGVMASTISNILLSPLRSN